MTTSRHPVNVAVLDDYQGVALSIVDWSKVSDDHKERFPIVPESALRATLGILERTVRTRA